MIEDIGALDLKLPDIMLNILSKLGTMMVGLAFLIYIYYGIAPLLGLLLLCCICYLYTSYSKVILRLSFLRTHHNAKVSNLYSELINSGIAIRGSGNMKEFEKTFMHENDLLRKYSALIANGAGRWLGARLNYVNTILTFFVFALPILMKSSGGFFSLELVYMAIGITWGIKMIKAMRGFMISMSKLLINMSSFYRLFDCIDLTPKATSKQSTDRELGLSKSQDIGMLSIDFSELVLESKRCAIRFNNVSFLSSNKEFTLDMVTLKIIPGEKIGLINLSNSSTIPNFFEVITGLKYRKKNRLGN